MMESIEQGYLSSSSLPNNISSCSLNSLFLFYNCCQQRCQGDIMTSISECHSVCKQMNDALGVCLNPIVFAFGLSVLPMHA